MIANLEQRCQKSPVTNGRGGTYSDPIGGGRAPKNKTSDIVIPSNGEGAGGFSKQKRERERASKNDDDRDEKQEGRCPYADD